MRKPMLGTFTRLWKALDAHQFSFIKALVGPFLELAMLEVNFFSLYRITKK